MKKQSLTRKPRTEVHTFRCSVEEYQRLKELSEKCGLSLSRYVVETGMNHHPRQRLTKYEIDALNSLAMARVDLIKISNALAKKTNEEKLKYFKNEKFMSWWINAATGLIRHWYSIEENTTSNVQAKNKEIL